MTANDRNFQLQGSYTRYEDGYHAGYDSPEGPNKRRNFSTLDRAIRAAKKEFKRNQHTKVVAIKREYYGPGEYDYYFHCYDEGGRKIPFDEPREFWHVDGIRIVDRVTQKVLWES